MNDRLDMLWYEQCKGTRDLTYGGILSIVNGGHMRVYGNLMNRIRETPVAVTPEVGMGCTILMYSDRHAATIVEVKSPKLIVIQRDTATRKDHNGQSESQNWEFSANPNAQRQEVSLRKNGRWMLAKGKMSNGTVVRIGERDEYYDFGF